MSNLSRTLPLPTCYVENQGEGGDGASGNDRDGRDPSGGEGENQGGGREVVRRRWASNKMSRAEVVIFFHERVPPQWMTAGAALSSKHNKQGEQETLVAWLDRPHEQPYWIACEGLEGFGWLDLLGPRRSSGCKPTAATATAAGESNTKGCVGGMARKYCLSVGRSM